MTARRFAACLATLAMAVGPAGLPMATAQQPTLARPQGSRPLLLTLPGQRATPLSQQAVPVLSAETTVLLSRAIHLRDTGQLDAARDALTLLLDGTPHHPVLLAELAQVHALRQAWRAIESLARVERAATRDSVLLVRELVQALERQVQPREAVQPAIEAWIAMPMMREWATTTFARLAITDGRAVREALRRAVESRPGRLDLLRGAVWQEWQGGDAAAAVRLLAEADRSTRGPPQRWTFAEELLASGAARDSGGAVEVLLDLAADTSHDQAYRLAAARRAWLIFGRRASEREGAPRVAQALQDIPAERWGNELLLSIVRSLRQAGQTAAARSLMAGAAGGSTHPELALEQALNELRDGPPEKALDALAALAATSEEAAFRYAEALFFAGQPDSALAGYQRLADDPGGAFTGAALERMFLLEEAEPRTGLPLFGRLAWEQWRGESKRALGLADSLYRSLPRGPLWAEAALALAAQREATGDGKAALEPLLAVADGLPGDRLAPLARQRAGDVLRIWHKDDARAVEQYEECLARYPKAWNAPEVRRTLETLRRDRRF